MSYMNFEISIQLVLLISSITLFLLSIQMILLYNLLIKYRQENHQLRVSTLAAQGKIEAMLGETEKFADLLKKLTKLKIDLETSLYKPTKSYED